MSKPIGLGQWQNLRYHTVNYFPKHLNPKFVNVILIFSSTSNHNNNMANLTFSLQSASVYIFLFLKVSHEHFFVAYHHNVQTPYSQCQKTHTRLHSCRVFSFQLSLVKHRRSRDLFCISITSIVVSLLKMKWSKNTFSIVCERQRIIKMKGKIFLSVEID